MPLQQCDLEIAQSHFCQYYLAMDKAYYVERLQAVHSVIDEACRKSLRDPSSVSLMAVSKTYAKEEISACMDAGQSLFGENHVAEALEKFTLVGPCRVHLIGHLQSNKARKAVSIFDSIDSVDSLRILSIIDSEALRIGRRTDVLLEYNTSGEQSKSGFESFDDVFRTIEQSGYMQGVKIKGLMTVGPLGGDEAALRKAFSLLRDLKDQCEKRFGIKLGTLSMGMSQDYPIAIEEGSTCVRIGTAIFGSRSYK